MSGPGRVFFVKPPNPVASFIWDLYLNQSMFVGQYLLVGTNDDAIEHTWFDSLLTKDFWRSKLGEVGARLPRQLGEWNDKTYKSYFPIGRRHTLIHAYPTTTLPAPCFSLTVSLSLSLFV